MSAASTRSPVAAPTGLASGEDDESLVELLRAGNLRALGMLFRRYGEVVRRLLLHVGIARRDVDDLVQETFLDAIDASVSFVPGRSVRAWLCGLAMIVARRHRRSVARMLRKITHWATSCVEPRVVTPADELEWTEDASRGQRALAQLPPKMREAFVLVVMEELTGSEAAAALDIPIATVWTRVHYARREMLRLLELEPR